MHRAHWFAVAFLAVAAPFLSAGDSSAEPPDPATLLAKSSEANRKLSTFECEVVHDWTDDDGDVHAASRWSARLKLRRGDLPAGTREFDPRAVPFAFAARGRFPSSLGPDEQDVRCAFDGETLRLHGAKSRRFLEYPVAKARISAWQLPESALVPQALWDPNFARLPGARLTYAGTEKVGGVECHAVRAEVSMTKCLPPGVDPATLGFELEGPPDPKAPGAGAGKPEGIVCVRVKVRVRLWIGVKDHLPRRMAVRMPGGPNREQGWARETYRRLRAGHALPDKAFRLKPRRGDDIERIPVEDLATFYGDPADLERRMKEQVRRTALPDAPLLDVAGKEHRLGDYKGRVLVLDFWGTWCAPCVASLPEIQALHEEFEKDARVVVLGIACNEQDREAPARVMKQKGCTYGLLVAGEGFASRCGIRGFPTVLVVDPDGKVVHVSLGVADTKPIAAAVRAALREVADK